MGNYPQLYEQDGEGGKMLGTGSCLFFVVVEEKTIQRKTGKLPYFIISGEVVMAEMAEMAERLTDGGA